MRLGLLRRIALALLADTWRDGGFELAICLVSAPEVTRLNEAFLRHKGPTDVITFDYTERVGQASRLPRFPRPSSRFRDRRDACATLLHGEIVVCLDEAVRQARRFHTTWQSELVRYVVHGVLHLLGYDDRDPRTRRRMKAAEDALVRRLARQYAFHDLSRTN
ncbi:MAG: rRNA maturation RNase YbeY [Limisphaerales bacterium]